MRILLLANAGSRTVDRRSVGADRTTPDMRAVIWVDEDSRVWRLNFKTMRIEPCGEEFSRSIANKLEGCW